MRTYIEMSIFGIFSKDPTTQWPLPPPLPLHLILPEGSLNGISFGDSYKNLIVFGRPANPKPYKLKKFYYPSQGLTVELSNDGRIDYYSFILSKDGADRGSGEKGFVPCQVVVRLSAERKIVLTSEFMDIDIKRAMGNPKRCDTEEEETVLFYERDGVEMEFEFGARGNLKRFNVFPSGKSA